MGVFGSQQVRRLFAATAAYFVKVDHLTPERLLEGEQDLRLVYSVLDTLPEKKRAVFILFELQGLSGAEIADLLRCPLDTVKTRLHYAREAFFSELENTASLVELDVNPLMIRPEGHGAVAADALIRLAV